jgi:CRP-like cAMP-binding protein
MTERYAPYDLFQWLPEHVRLAFVKEARIRRYSSGQTIFTEGDAGSEMFRILSGAVRLSVARATGREVIYALFKAGDCFGDSSCIDGAARSQTAEAAGSLQLQVLDRATFDRLRATHREFDQALLRLVTLQLRRLSVFNADSHLNDLPARVATRILTIANAFGAKSERGSALFFRLSQSELALMVGLSRQTVNRILQQFRRDKILQIGYGNLEILDLEGLRRRAERP